MKVLLCVNLVLKFPFCYCADVAQILMTMKSQPRLTLLHYAYINYTNLSISVCYIKSLSLLKKYRKCVQNRTSGMGK